MQTMDMQASAVPLWIRKVPACEAECLYDMKRDVAVQRCFQYHYQSHHQ